MPVFERNLVAPEYFYLAASGAIELYLSDIGSDLHAVGSGIHAQGATDGARYPDEPLHAAEVIFRAKGHRATEIRRRVDLREGARDDYLGLGLRQLEYHPGQLSISHQQVRPPADK